MVVGYFPILFLPSDQGLFRREYQQHLEVGCVYGIKKIGGSKNESEVFSLDVNWDGEPLEEGG